jgi:DnaJ-domain-containing protein 1
MAKKYITNSEVPIQESMHEIRVELSKIGVSGMDIDCRYDVNTGAAIVRFKRNGVTYERRSTQQPNVSKNMRVIALNLKHKVLDHLRGVEPFEDSMYKYAALPPGKDAPNEDAQARPPEHIPRSEVLAAYAVLGVDAYATAPQVEKAYKHQLLAWHPDRHHADAEMLALAEKKTSEINSAWQLIKRERGIA